MTARGEMNRVSEHLMSVGEGGFQLNDKHAPLLAHFPDYLVQGMDGHHPPGRLQIRVVADHEFLGRQGKGNGIVPAILGCEGSEDGDGSNLNRCIDESVQ